MKEIKTDEDVVYILNEFFLAFENSKENWWSYDEIEEWWLQYKRDTK